MYTQRYVRAPGLQLQLRLQLLPRRSPYLSSSFSSDHLVACVASPSAMTIYSGLVRAASVLCSWRAAFSQLLETLEKKKKT